MMPGQSSGENNGALSMSFPTRFTARLLLREPRLSDAEDFYRLRSDPGVNRYLDRQPCESVEQADAYLRNLRANLEKGDGFYWVVEIKETSAFAGSVCLFHVDAGKAEMGFELLPDFQGKGIMLEAGESIVDFARQQGLTYLEAFTHPANMASQHLLKNLQFCQTPPSGDVPDCIRFERRFT